jgi:hypothetical protein
MLCRDGEPPPRCLPRERRVLRDLRLPQASHINDPAHWRERAKQMRQMAEGATDRVATEYDHLAERADDPSNGQKPS